MAAVLLSMQDAPCLMNHAMILSLIDQSWYSRSILDHSMARLSVPLSTQSSATRSVAGAELRPALRSSSTIGALCEGWMHATDESEIRRVFDRFDEDADGLISREELRRWCTKCYGKDVSETQADSMISSVDLNNDGAVDFNEFLSLYQTHCTGAEERMDVVEEPEDNSNNSGCDSEDEGEQEDLLLEAFDVFDMNHDGYISAEELQTVLINLGMLEGKSLMTCEEMIRNMAGNKDGRCDRRDFQEMMSAKSL